jgi:hypothetical protein
LKIIVNDKNGFVIVFENAAPDGMLYAREKLGVAVWKLATGVGGIKERLSDAFIEIVILQENDFPRQLRDQWKQICSDLTCGKMQYDTKVEDGHLVKVPVGKLYSTLRYMRKKKAQNIAKRICLLEARLGEYM